MIKLLAAAGLSLLLVGSANHGLLIESCRGACDRTDKTQGEWRRDVIIVPEGEECTAYTALIEGQRWLELNRPGFNFAGAVCVREVGKMT